MRYTPKMLQAYLFIAGKRRRRELRELLYLTTLGSRGEERAVTRQLREWDS
jgi:hypothetical protein